MEQPASYWIKELDLKPHPEGGFYRETYRSAGSIDADHLPKKYNGRRSYCTAIYFLLEKGLFSALHRIASDEIWHFYAGGAVEIFVIDTEGNLTVHKLGRDIKGNEILQCVVPGGSWFGARPAQSTEFSLVGCTVAPGFDFADFEMGNRQQLIESFPHLKTTIELLTH